MATRVGRIVGAAAANHRSDRALRCRPNASCPNRFRDRAHVPARSVRRQDVESGWATGDRVWLVGVIVLSLPGRTRCPGPSNDRPKEAHHEEM